jgi:hypothetical protein
MEPELVRRLSSDLEGLASALHRAGARPDAATRLLELASAAIIDAVTLSGLRDAPYRLSEAGGVHSLHRQVEASPREAARLLLAQQADRPLPDLALDPDPKPLAG